MVKEIYLVTRNARDKVQVVHTILEQKGNNFTIHRITGQYEGKMSEQPILSIERGKAKRTVLQQAELEFNSIVKKYQDKGYKLLSTLTTKEFSELSPDEMNNIVPSVKSDSNGNLKPMLAKRSEDCQNSVLNKPMWCSRKLDGVRCMIKYNSDADKIITVSRGGKDYNCSAQLITAELYDYLKQNPTIVLDGELYHHGMHLQYISGIARKKEWDDRFELLEYWIYDVAIPDKEFEKDRLPILRELQELFKDSTRVKVLEHTLSKSWNDIQNMHDKFVEEGFEGLVCRKPDKKYEFGKRGSTMIKVKQYQDDEFLIVDYKDGLREEDFCFVCETKDGNPFSAKPIGDRALRAYYLEHIDEIIGLYGKVKFFNYSAEGTPTQTHFQSVRFTEDMDQK